MAEQTDREEVVGILGVKWKTVFSQMYGMSIVTVDDVPVCHGILDPGVATDIVEAHNTQLDDPNYNRVDHFRLVTATQVAATLRDEVKVLKEALAERTHPQDMPLWKRIAMQRRELRVLNGQAMMYRKWWREEKERIKE